MVIKEGYWERDFNKCNFLQIQGVMRIAKNELLAGIPVLKIRDYFRLLYSGLMTRDGLAERFNLNEKETEGLVGELLSKG